MLIAGVDPARNAARLPLVLARSGCRVTALCPNDTSLAHSRLVERHIASDRADDAATVRALHGILAESFDLVLIADEALLFAMASRLQGWMRGVLPVAADIEALRLILDKHAMLRTMRDAGVPVPRFITVDGPRALGTAADEVGYPLVLKDSAGCGGVGVRRVAAAGELTDAYDSLDPAGAVTVQRYVTGRSGCTDVLFDHGVPRCWTSAQMLDQWPSPFDPATVREPVVEPRIEAMARAVGAATGFHGFGGIDWIRDEHDQLYFLEFNPRATHIVGPARAAFAAEVGAMLRGIPATPHEVIVPARPIPIFPLHLIRAWKTLRIGEMLKWLPFRSTASDLDWKDFSVVTFELRQMLAGGFRSVLALFGVAVAPRNYDYTRRVLQEPAVTERSV